MSFLLAATVGLFLSYLTWRLTKKSGLVPAQDRLVTTLEANTKALTQQVSLLKEQLDEEKAKRADLSAKYDQLVIRTDALEEQLADLLVENADLRKKLLAAKRPAQA